MDVTRINAYSPKTIDWRKLTAKDIIKYESQGVEVPSTYLQWAQNFRVDLAKNDTDETTYEMAISKTSKNNQRQNVSSDENQSTNSTDSTTNTEEVSKSDEKPVEEMTAEEKLKFMKDNNEGLYGITKTFTEDSNQKGSNAESATSTVNSLEETSNNQIELLEADMQQTLSEIDDLKTKIKNEAKENKQNQIQNILKFQNDVVAKGEAAQNVLAIANSEFDSIQTLLAQNSGFADPAIDFGNATVVLGDECKKIGRVPWMVKYYILGQKAENAGNEAINQGVALRDALASAEDSNSNNISIANSYTNQVTSKTGVQAVNINNKVNENDKSEVDIDNEKADNISEQNNIKEEQLDISNKSVLPENNNDKTENEVKEEKIASGSLDEILKRKIRKGEEV